MKNLLNRFALQSTKTRFFTVLSLALIAAALPITLLSLKNTQSVSQKAAEITPAQVVPIVYPTYKTINPCTKGIGGMHCLYQLAVDNQGKLINHTKDFKKWETLHIHYTVSDPVLAQASNDQYSTTRLHTAYQLPCTPGGPVQTLCSQPASFGPQTVAVIDEGGYPNLEADLAVYDQTYNLPICTVANGCLSIMNESGGPSNYPPMDGWTVETALDAETVHAICQTCKILVVQADPQIQDLSAVAQAVDTAVARGATAVSISMGGNEAKSSAFASHFNHPRVAIVAASGDWLYNNQTVVNEPDLGAGANVPAAYPSVISVGGTVLNLVTVNGQSQYQSEQVWNDYPYACQGPYCGAGSACSQAFSAPSWQTSLPNWKSVGCGTKRAIADVSAAAKNVSVYSSYAGNSMVLGSGTSWSAPVIASIIALNGGVANVSNPAQIPYLHPGNFHDVTQGNNGSCNGQAICTAGKGYDGPTGLGTPNGIDGFKAANAPNPTTAPTSVPTAQPTITKPITQPSPTGNPINLPSPTLAASIPPIYQGQASVKLTLTVRLLGVSNQNTQKIAVDLYDGNNNKVTSQGSAFTPDNNGDFTGSVNFTNLATGVYLVKVYTLGYLHKEITKPIQLNQPTQTITLDDPVILKPGDVNGDNIIDLQDFRLLVSCVNNQNQQVCKNADFNQDGKVDILDYQLLMSSLSVWEGD